ncbi:MAG: PPOX class F420-dependent oxidoreductase [Candidatus Lokiarchaeota archaeon]|nr:PPOX class F420-dependent oxidoreductase [Candidatus Lokiarchaeota archaeon]
MSEKLTPLQKGKYLSLKTYRKSGTEVERSVWFVEENLKFFVSTGPDTFKAKHMRNNPKVQIASTTGRKINSEYIDAEASFLSKDDEIEPIVMLFRKKYRMFKLWSSLRNRKKEESEKQIYIEITPK